MIKKFVKKSIAFLLILCITMTMSSTVIFAKNAENESTGAKAPVKTGSFLVEAGLDKCLETGMRVLAETTNMIGESTGSESAEEACSIISNWVFSSGAEAAAAKTQELCEEILKEMKVIKKEIDDDFSVTNNLIEKTDAKITDTTLKQKWTTDVEYVISAPKVNYAFNSYKTYLNDAVNYNSDGSGSVSKDKIEKDYDELIDSLLKIDSSNSNMNDSREKKIEKMFYSSVTNESIYNVIDKLSGNLYDDRGGTVLGYAAQYAWDTMRFSHEQYEFVYNYAETQIYQIIIAEMLYNEYLYQQGEYIKANEEDYKNSNAYVNYLKYQDKFYKLLTDTVIPNIKKMLDQEITVDTNYKVSLDSYMKPEDVGVCNFNINGYESKYYAYSHNDTYTSSKKYIPENNLKFNKVMTQSGNNKNVYYILDTEQFSSNSAALKALAMDCKHDQKLAFDVHIASCDYINLTQKTMTDGVNTFKCTKNIYDLFGTNAFYLYGSKPSSYLSPYLPSGKVLLMTEYYDNFPPTVGTGYENFDVIECDSAISGTEIITEEYSAEKFQSDHGGSNLSYSIVLSNTNSDYNQQATLTLPAGVTASITDSDGNELISEFSGDDSKSNTIKSGEMIKFKFKAEDAYLINSFKCIRSNDSETETELFNHDDINFLSKEGDYYVFNYPMPYSKCEFVFDTVPGYSVTADDEIKNNFVLESDSEYFAEGDKVVFTIKGCSLDCSKLKVNDQELTLTKNDGNDYVGSFTMPAEDVVISRIPVLISLIKLSPKTAEVYVGDSITLNADIIPENADKKGQLSWFTSDKDIATVDNNGNVTTYKEGTVTITAKSEDNVDDKDKAYDTATITVIKKPVKVSSIEVSPKSAELYPNETIQLLATVSPENADIKDVTWSSSDENIATVDKNGLVTAKSEGEVEIFATAKDNINISVSSKITVKPDNMVHNGDLRVYYRIDNGNGSYISSDILTDSKGIVASIDNNNKEITFNIPKSTTYVALLKMQCKGSDGKYHGMFTPADESIVYVEDSKTETKKPAFYDKNGCIFFSRDNAETNTTYKVDYRLDNYPAVTYTVKFNKLDGNSYLPHSTSAFSKKQFSLKVGKEYEISNLLSSEGILNLYVEDESILSIRDNTVKALKKGSTLVYAENEEGQASSVRVDVVQPVTKIKITGKKLLGVKKSISLKSVITPSIANNKAVTWTSSNKNIATVNSKGVITGKKAGTVTITAKAKDGSGVKATYKVTVRQFASKISVNKTKVTLKVKKSINLKARVTPSNTTIKKVKWTSSNSKIATVNAKGKVIAKKYGKVTIICKTLDGSNKTAKCVITVKK